MQQALDGEELVRPWIGVTYIAIDPALAAEQDLPVDYGALIAGVEEGQPAAEAGIQEGDVITRVGDTAIADATALTAAIRAQSPGDRLEVTFTRDGDEQTVEVTLGELPGDSQ